MAGKQKYLPHDAKEKLDQYVYKGQDKSYIYKNFWRPLITKLVNYLPVWLAPNVITISALVGVCVVHVLLSYSMPSFAVGNTFVKESPELRHEVNYDASYGEYLPPPRYVLLLAAFTLFLYQLLDNLDGHQARRTGTSSPLGLLMDHGCDAFNCIIGGLNLCMTLATGPSWKTFLVLTNTVVVFFLNTWEEYYRGELVLPVINGPNEGILIAISFYLFTAWQGGPQWWSANAIEIPAKWLPAVLRQPAPQAAAAVEKVVLEKICPWLTRPDRSAGEFSALPFFFNLNCTPSYMAQPQLPTRREVNTGEASPVMSTVWRGNSPVQQAVLRLFGSSEGTLRMKYNTVAVWVMTVMAVVTAASHVCEVYRAIRKLTPEERKEKFGRRRFPFLHSLSRVIPTIAVTLLSVLWFVTSQEDIFRRHPRLFCWTVGLLVTKLTIHLMVAHLLSQPYQPFRKTFIPITVFAGHILLTYFHNVSRARKEMIRGMSLAEETIIGGSHSNLPYSSYAQYAYDMDEEMVLYEFFFLSLVSFVHLAYYVVRETAHALSVSVFTVPKDKQLALLAKEKERKAQRKAQQKKG
ncbi:CDP-alcohol phosphatidyltransferase, putative [Angomonas deanei]|uniref:CDP-alcohol phosphatidyltransferase, putative n=1 Tax=Angomonas deanei TaxID=59799 RepID=A0A7G2CSB9_9TRYP|nr:CDP-alcohol phosphatidyltransferase, putative [Angomonas deanei]